MRCQKHLRDAGASREKRYALGFGIETAAHKDPTYLWPRRRQLCWISDSGENAASFKRKEYDEVFTIRFDWPRASKPAG